MSTRRPCTCVASKGAQASASWLSGGSSQRRIVPQVALSFGQPRPISRLGRAGRPYRPLLSTHTDAFFYRHLGAAVVLLANDAQAAGADLGALRVKQHRTATAQLVGRRRRAELEVFKAELNLVLRRVREVEAHEAHASIDHARQRGQRLGRRPDGGHDLGEGQPQPTESRHFCVDGARSFGTTCDEEIGDEEK